MVKSKKIIIIYIFIKDMVINELIKILDPKLFKVFCAMIEIY